MQPDFIRVNDLSGLTGVNIKTLYNAHCSGTGPLSEILTKMGGRLGAWRPDYQVWLNRQRKLRDESDAAA
jgi:hypothetical protein